MTDTILRGACLSFSAEPDSASHAGVQYLEDAVVAIHQGTITSVMSATDWQSAGNNLADCTDLRGSLILPGFIDTHIHYPQIGIIASYGTQLLDWLEHYAFPAEISYQDLSYAEAQAEVFMNMLFRHGTTTALTFTTVHEHTTDALFAVAEHHNARMIAGKVLMNRNAPEALTDGHHGSANGIDESAALIERWHNKGRLQYAVTPRFAITCTDDQLTGAGELLKSFPGTYLHTHLAEHPNEIASTLELFPRAKDYVDVYDRFELLGERSVFAHGIHLSDAELARLAETGSGIAFCPTSNMFLGSGLLQLDSLRHANVRTSVGSDVGGGTSFSMFTTLGEGYKVTQLNGETWHPFTALHAITRGNAEALGLGDKIGQVAAGFEADLTVLRPRPGSVLDMRVNSATSITDQIFAAMLLGGDDAIAQTWVAGTKVYDRDTQAAQH